MPIRKQKSLFVKILSIVAVAIVLIFAVTETMIIRSKFNEASIALAEEATTVTRLVAMQIGGSVKFGNELAIEEVVDSVRTSAGPVWDGAAIINSRGIQLYPGSSEGAETGADPALVALAETAMTTGETVEAEGGLVTAMPIVFGNESAIAGAIVTKWTLEPKISAMMTTLRNEIIGSGLAFLIVLGGLSLALRFWVSAPLKRLEKSVSEVASGAYDLVVPDTARADEVGEIARQLEGFRAKLSDGKQMQVDSAYKSAAYEGSSAPLMVINREFEVIYCNPACKSLVEILGDQLARKWPGLNSSEVVGSSIASLQGLEKIISEVREKHEKALPSADMLAFGDARVRIKLNAALDTDGEMIGAVVELSDRTAAYRNDAMVSAIDTAMIRADFDSSGRLHSANDNFMTALSISESDLGRVNFGDIFEPEGSVSANPIAEDAITGRFVFKSAKTDEMRFADGGFVAISGLNGKREKSLFVGLDVTESESERLRIEEEKSRSDAEQEQVVSALGEALTNLSSGKLNAEIDTPFAPSYEDLRKDFNNALSALRNAIGSVVQNTASIRSETGEITSAADDLSRRTERQAATLEETAAALDELTNSVRSAAEGAQGASEKATAAQGRAQEGGEVARQAVSAMDGIKSSSQEISNITSVIDDIAFQTNLLALNAGVEAARAGEAGRGFAVVATEVRALAQRSSDAAREINELISASENQVKSGVELVDKTGSALSAIVESISEITDLVSNIAMSTREQASGLNEINTAVTELDQVTQQNAAMFEETTAASYALTSETDALAQAVSKFELGDQAVVVAQVSKSQRRPDAARVSHERENQPVKQMPIAASHGSAALDSSRDEAGWEEF